jgi:hypothetical protein
MLCAFQVRLDCEHAYGVLQAPKLLMEFLRKLRKFLATVDVGETVILPAFVARAEMLIILERTTAQQYTFIIIQTSPAALRYHPVSPTDGPPKLKYRTALVLPNIPKKVKPSRSLTVICACPPTGLPTYWHGRGTAHRHAVALLDMFVPCTQ